ncbi:MAG: hypothetical protein IT176_00120 [Acidobacteria bacterium]|nr:hypothetical protein [Acidobacteriota bacterium]
MIFSTLSPGSTSAKTVSMPGSWASARATASAPPGQHDDFDALFVQALNGFRRLWPHCIGHGKRRDRAR